MYCVHCGAQLGEEARFCSQCGAFVESPSCQAPPTGAESPLNGYNADPYACDGNYCRSYDYDPESRPINDFLLWNILATLFCCMPCGIVGIIFSYLCAAAKRRGDFQAARLHSSNAQVLFWISLVGGIIVCGVYVCGLLFGSIMDSLVV